MADSAGAAPVRAGTDACVLAQRTRRKSNWQSLRHDSVPTQPTGHPSGTHTDAASDTGGVLRGAASVCARLEDAPRHEDVRVQALPGEFQDRRGKARFARSWSGKVQCVPQHCATATSVEDCAGQSTCVRTARESPDHRTRAELPPAQSQAQSTRQQPAVSVARCLGRSFECIPDWLTRLIGGIETAPESRLG